MRDTQLYAQILGIASAWKVTNVELDLPHDEVRVHVEHGGKTLTCPECGTACSGYDKRQRRWRHLDTCQYRTILIADVPRVNCAEHGLKQVAVPWSEPGSRFTAMFEALTIDWLREASIAAVARRLNLSWDEGSTITGSVIVPSYAESGIMRSYRGIRSCSAAIGGLSYA